MNEIRTWSLLRKVLLLDGVSAGLLGVGLLALTEVLAGLLQLPATLLTQAGLVLVPFGAIIGWLAFRQQPPAWAVWTVIGINVLWAAESVLMLVMGTIAPNTLGMVFVIGQAVIVAVFAELEFIGLRREALRPAHG